MQTINLSANIENGTLTADGYIATPNAQRAASNIAQKFKSGIHSFSIIGSYGTGKSSFLLALEHDLDVNNKQKLLLNPENLSSSTSYEIINIVGDYAGLATLLRQKLNIEGDFNNVIDYLRDYYDKLKAEGKFLVIVIDEFGKILEYAAQNNPEEELYSLQKFSEFVNVSTRNILLLTTLHQGFGAYSKKLTESQRNEWTKVKGRFQEITFVEPAEVLLNLVSEKLQTKRNTSIYSNADTLFDLAHEAKIVTPGFSKSTAKNLYPLDAFSAVAITEAILRYGQNERSLFSFMIANGSNSLSQFVANEQLTYNLATVYDYVNYIFYSVLRDANADSGRWSAVSAAIGRAENIDWQDVKQLDEAVKIIKAIGILDIFAPSNSILTTEQMRIYAENAMSISDAALIINKLTQFKVIRFAEYNQRLKLFAGTDVDIEAEIVKAAAKVARPTDYIDTLRWFFNKRISPAKSCYYQNGTPRFFDYRIEKEPVITVASGDIDGYIELIFSQADDALENVKTVSAQTDEAIIFAFFNNTDKIVENIYNIQKYKYILEKVLLDEHDDVANKEIKNLIEYEENLLNKQISDNLFSYDNSVTWIYKGNEQSIKSLRDFNVLISNVCNDVYNQTPVMNNELFNRHKLSAQIATARKNLIHALLTSSDKPNLGFDDEKFPPEKTIYFSLIKNTGLHTENGLQERPSNPDIATLWQASEEFLQSTVGKAKKLSELVKTLSERPMKLKQGFIDIWLPIYLIIKRNDYALYESETGAYCPKLEEYMFELLPKKPGKYSVKAFATEGVNLEFFNQYRKFINLGEEFTITSDKIIETIRPFLFFYNRLNDYAKHTRKFSKKSTMKFRDVLAKAKDPEKTFFEDLPEALGFKKDGDNFDTYGETLQNAIKELRQCYSQLIDRIESRLIKELKIKHKDYTEYITEIQGRLSSVKTHLLTPTQLDFYNRVMLNFNERAKWYQAICYPILNHPLEKLRDDEEAPMLDELIFLFQECEKYADISKKIADDDTAEAYSFDMVSNRGTNLRTKTFVLREQEKEQSTDLERQISALLTGDNNIDIVTLLRVLDVKLKSTK